MSAESDAAGPSPVAVVLAAGLGTRMGGRVPKVLLEAGGQRLIDHGLATLRQAGITRIVMVQGPESPRPSEVLAGDDLEYVVQHDRLGTGHAVLQAKEAVGDAPFFVLNGDMPLLRAASLSALQTQRRAADAYAALLVAEDEAGRLPTLGRVFVREDETIERMIEARDLKAHPEWERPGPRLVNVGAYLFEPGPIWSVLEALGTDNAQGEYYLTDVVAMLSDRGHRTLAVRAVDPDEAMGANTPAELQALDDALRRSRPSGE